MDDDDFRRGRPSNHKAFGEATAILAGDALLTHGVRVDRRRRLAFCRAAAFRQRRRGAGARGGGGGHGARPGARPGRTGARHLAELETLHAEKTAALFRASLEIGGCAAGAPPDELAALARFGTAYGIAFQHADDRADAEHGTFAAAARDWLATLVADACAALAPLGTRGSRLAELARALETRVANSGRNTVVSLQASASPLCYDDHTGDGLSTNRQGCSRPRLRPEASVKRDRAYLVVLAGASVGEMYKIEARRPSSAAVKRRRSGSTTTASRASTRVLVEGSRIFLQDLGSTNGTFCNGIQVDKKELVDGDKILVGSTTILKFTYHDYLDEVFQRQMYESALRDGLTKAFNKKYFTDRLESEFAFSTPARDAAGAGAVRHRSLQEDQRHPRPPGGRLRAGRDVEPAQRHAAHRGRVRPLRRRGVRRHLPRLGHRPRRRSSASGCARRSRSTGSSTPGRTSR